jgi:hypothetical protein
VIQDITNQEPLCAPHATTVVKVAQRLVIMLAVFVNLPIIDIKAGLSVYVV